MHDVATVRVAQRVGKQAQWRQNIGQRPTSQRPEIVAIDELQAVESLVLIFVKFKYADDVGVHQAQIGLPLIAQATGCVSTGRHDLQSHRGSRHPVFGQPGRGFAAGTERPLQRVPVG